VCDSLSPAGLPLPQAYNIDARAESEKEEKKKEIAKVTGKAERMKQDDAWFQQKHATEFPKHGKICIRSSFRKYLDCNKKFAECDSGAPVFWSVHPPDDGVKRAEGAPLESIVLRKKTKVLLGQGGDVCVFGPPASAEWKALMKAPGKYIFMNEEGHFLKCEKDGTVSVAPIHDLDDMVAVRPFILDLKLKTKM